MTLNISFIRNQIKSYAQCNILLCIKKSAGDNWIGYHADCFIKRFVNFYLIQFVLSYDVSHDFLTIYKFSFDRKLKPHIYKR